MFMNNTTFPSLIAFVDPYWMGAESADLDPDRLQLLLKTLSAQHKLERVYLYQESDKLPALHALDVPCTVRACAQDALDDGYELIRAMDQDMQQLAAFKASSAFVVVSMDDRLALSIERIKAQGLCVIGLTTHALTEVESSAQRMARVFDRMIEWHAASPRLSENAHTEVSLEPDGASSQVIDQVIGQWFEEADELARDSAMEFIHNRRGLPRHVDSRLLFLCSKALGRELTEPEKIALRGRFRHLAKERTVPAQA